MHPLNPASLGLYPPSLAQAVIGSNNALPVAWNDICQFKSVNEQVELQ